MESLRSYSQELYDKATAIDIAQNPRTVTVSKSCSRVIHISSNDNETNNSSDCENNSNCKRDNRRSDNNEENRRGIIKYAIRDVRSNESVFRANFCSVDNNSRQNRLVSSIDAMLWYTPLS